MRPIGVLLVAGLVFGVTGCTPQSSTLAGIIDGAVVVKVCRDMEIDSITVDTFDESDEFVEVWALNGDAHAIPEGSTLVLGETPPGFDVEHPYADGTFDPARHGLVVSLRLVGVRSDVATFGMATLKEGTWIDVTGRERQGC